MATDVGLRKFMLGVFNKMALGLVLSAALAWAAGSGTFPEVTSSCSSPRSSMSWHLGLLVLLLGSAFAIMNPFAARQQHHLLNGRLDDRDQPGLLAHRRRARPDCRV